MKPFFEKKNVEGSSSGNLSEDPSKAYTATTVTKSRGDASSVSHSSDTSSSFSLARTETQQVIKTKGVLLAVVLLAAGVCGLAVHLVIEAHEHLLFTEQFHDFAVEVADVSHEESFQVFSAVHSMSTDVSSLSMDAGFKWPYNTIPHFEMRAYGNNELTSALQLSFAVLISQDEREGWETYVRENQSWLEESYELQETIHANSFHQRDLQNGKVSEKIRRFENYVDGDLVVQDGPGIDYSAAAYAPVWQQGPAPLDPRIINFDLLSHPVFDRLYHGMWETKKPVLSESLNLEFLYGGAVQDDSNHPHSFLLAPVYPSFDEDDHHHDEMNGFFVSVLPWDTYFSNILPASTNGIIVVLHDSCGDHFTYRIDGKEAIFLGNGDLHERRFDYLAYDTEFAPFLRHEYSDKHEHCEYDLRIFPSSDFEGKYITNKPAIFTAVVVMLFAFIASIFICYDIFVRIRNNKVMKAAKVATAVVSSMFPAKVRDRILREAEEQAERELAGEDKKLFKFAPKAMLKNFIDDEEENAAKTSTVHESAPIADLYASATVMHADIVGFTAWSSMREPNQIFTFLETVYRSYDTLAKRRRVFKVETIGDCYVAVCGLPDARKDHAVAMARFALDCQHRMNDLTKILEVKLGPDTGDLRVRIGLHSGPVTAGVLRGDKSRFQLFGSTINVVSMVEKTGQANRIHLSEATAKMICELGKSHWVIEREPNESIREQVGMKTYWLELKLQSSASRKSHSTCSSTKEGMKWAEAGLAPIRDGKKKGSAMDEKTDRLIEWNTNVLARLLTQIVLRRKAAGVETTKATKLYLARGNNASVIDEVVETIQLPQFDAEAARADVNSDKIDLEQTVYKQLEKYISEISKRYHDNPFHNFEHASHVAMSVSKLLSRIVAPDYLDLSDRDDSDSSRNVAYHLHDHTYGINSDPLTQFACVFASVIHDVDHQGVPNAQLIKENSATAIAYKGKSVAEQNSVDVAWKLLMEQRFEKLREAICCNDQDMRHFRQLVVNSVMATDIVDKELKVLRNDRWERAFNENLAICESEKDHINRKATIVIEHLIQASDVSHTMQHWNIYRKWNEAFFLENYKAYREGRAERDPSEFWYKGEIGFFDFYIIPLAKKLKECGVFGVSSDEYLNYAACNRKKWVDQGESVVAELITKYEHLFDDDESTGLDTGATKYM